MKLLYLSHFFPNYPARFTTDEVGALRDQGIDLDVLGFRRLHSGLESHDPSEAIYLTDLRWEWLIGFSFLLRHPVVTMKTAAAVLLTPHQRRDGVTKRLHAALTYLRAIGVIGLIARRGYTHVHSDFIDDTATACWIARRFLSFEMSMRDHMSFNAQLVPQKLRSSSLVFACCEANREALLRVCPELDERIVTNYLGVDLKRWVPVGVPTRHPPMILCVGTLQEKKGQRYLLDACARLRSIYPDIRCVFAGDGPDREDLTDQARALELVENAEFLGTVDESRVRELMDEATIFCLPSVLTDAGDTDGIPVVLMEAMALQLPCVSTASGGIRELIDDGVNGLLVPQKDHVALADALARLLKDPDFAASLGMAAREKIGTRFDLTRNARELAAQIAGTPSFSASGSGD